MRLTCPACKAQYEVPTDVIPEDGRDVQCSNCGETWFQEHPDAETFTSPPTGSIRRTGALERSLGAANEAPGRDTATDAQARPEPEEEEAPAEAAGGSMPVRRKLDPSVADVLREEAELEARARRNELAGSVESQPELGLAEAFAPSGRVSEAETARPSAPTGQAPEPAASRSEAGTGPAEADLPDAGKINSTLRANAGRPADDRGQAAQTEARERRSFRSGFALVIALAAVCVIVYAFAPHLAEGTPELDPWLSAYVARVDEGRMWLNAHVRDLLDWLDTVAAANRSGE